MKPTLLSKQEADVEYLIFPFGIDDIKGMSGILNSYSPQSR